jgi:ABC-type antimicrobial peptide transport system permease subunit
MSYKIVLGLLIMIIFVGLFSGSYPALFLSSFKPIESLKQVAHKGMDSYNFRRILVIFQFGISVVLIICTLMTFKQLDYIQNKKLGINKENVMFLSLRGNSKEKYETLKSELVKNEDILSITRASSLPYQIGSNSGSFNWEDNKNEDNVLIGFEFTDFDYTKTLGLNIVEGRYFSKDFASDSNAVVINEKAKKLMGLDNPINKWLTWGDDNKFNIVGVVEDFHHLPMNHEIEPLFLFYVPKYTQIMYIKIAGDKVKETINHMQSTWKEINPQFPFEYKFLDENYDQLYRNEGRLSKIIMLFSFIAIFISCLGLYGLISYMTELRTKEIGIRKILGSSIWEIVLLMSKSYMKWILIANIIAFPIAYYAMNQWLRSYAFHTKFHVWIFAVAFVISFTIAIITISTKTIRTANSNPVDALRYE